MPFGPRPYVLSRSGIAPRWRGWRRSSAAGRSPAILESGVGFRPDGPLEHLRREAPACLRGHGRLLANPVRHPLDRDRQGRPDRRGSARLLQEYGLAQPGGATVERDPEELAIPGGDDRPPRLRPRPADRAPAAQGRARVAVPGHPASGCTTPPSSPTTTPGLVELRAWDLTGRGGRDAPREAIGSLGTGPPHRRGPRHRARRWLHIRRGATSAATITSPRSASAIDYIRAGDVFQVNLSHRFTAREPWGARSSAPTRWPSI